mmetsp:Transcript_59833/g.109518  ORF Transcript_59833/g.109518 Transcript_59833/m.109518 type:complete len:93 (+) Transcript_59833:132-410(+)
MWSLELDVSQDMYLYKATAHHAHVLHVSAGSGGCRARASSSVVMVVIICIPCTSLMSLCMTVPQVAIFCVFFRAAFSCKLCFRMPGEGSSIG